MWYPAHVLWKGLSILIKPEASYEWSRANFLFCIKRKKDKPQDFTCFQLQIDQNLNCEVQVLPSKTKNARVDPWREGDSDERKGCRQRVSAILSCPPLLSLRETDLCLWQKWKKMNQKSCSECRSWNSLQICSIFYFFIFFSTEVANKPAETTTIYLRDIDIDTSSLFPGFVQLIIYYSLIYNFLNSRVPQRVVISVL